MGYVKKYSDEKASTSATKHEVTRDIVIWFCRDLLAFENVGKDGLRDFFKINVPAVQLPAPVTLGGTALEDVYQAVRSSVRMKLVDVKSVCLMFDGWTDRYKARSYLGVRHSWKMIGHTQSRHSHSPRCGRSCIIHFEEFLP